MASLKQQREQVKRGIALLTHKEVNGTLSVQERRLLRGLPSKLAEINRSLSAPKSPKPRSKTPRTKQGPAGGITSVVFGGAPGSGKRA